MWQLVELCNKGYNSNFKNLLVKHQNNSVYWHRWRLLSGVSLICFYGIILEIFLAELYGWLTLDERAFARLYPGNHELAVSPGTVSPRSKEATVSSEITLLLTRGLSVQSINISFDAPRGTHFSPIISAWDQNGAGS